MNIFYSFDIFFLVENNHNIYIFINYYKIFFYNLFSVKISKQNDLDIPNTLNFSIN